jgi:hypothetical protein
MTSGKCGSRFPNGNDKGRQKQGEESEGEEKIGIIANEAGLANVSE